MAQGLATQILKNRSQFINHLKADLSKIDEIIEAGSKQVDVLRLTAANVEELGKKVEHPSLIPLGKNIYVNGTIVHTGEYYLDKLAFPESYSVLETLENTIKQLENKIRKQSELLEKSKTAKEQLEERISLLEGDSNEEAKEIMSDKGVAVKVGEFYEILEFEN